MTVTSNRDRCTWLDLVPVHALRALPPKEAANMLGHLQDCVECRQELAALDPVLGAFVFWPADLLRPSDSLRERLAQRIAADTGGTVVLPPACANPEPEWERVGPGIHCKLLAADSARDRVSMLIRLDPGSTYPPHVHAGVEELHLLHGELWIDARKLYPGDYSQSLPGTTHEHVWSDTGCMCILVTSSKDMLR